MSALGKITNLPSADYHSADAVSHSRLEVYRRRPALYRKRYVTRELPSEQSDALEDGICLHALILEGRGAFDQTCVVKPDDAPARPSKKQREAVKKSPSTLESIAWWDNFNREASGKIVLNAERRAMIENMAAEIALHPQASQLLAGGESEVTWRTTLMALPIPVQCRTDKFNEAGCEFSGGRPFVADIKSVDSLDEFAPRNFERAFLNFGYHRQVGLYLPLIQDCQVVCRDWFFIVAEKREPYGVMIYRPNQDAINRGLSETVDDLHGLGHCYERNLWPNCPTGIHEIGLPDWYINRAT
jgi:hypothetical protein